MAAADDIGTGFALVLKASYNPKTHDASLMNCISLLRDLDPMLKVWCEAGKQNHIVASLEDLDRARGRSRRKRGSPATEDPATTLRIGWEIGETVGALSVHPMWYGGLRWFFFCTRAALQRLLGDPPKKARRFFRELVDAVRASEASWAEMRDSMLIGFDLYSEQLRPVLPPYMPPSRPIEAIPPGYLIHEGTLEGPFPSGVWWHNYFGPKLVKLFGRKVLCSLPAAVIEETSDGGCLLCLCEEFFSIDRPDHLLAQRNAVERLGLREYQIERVLPQYRSSPWPDPRHIR